MISSITCRFIPREIFQVVAGYCWSFASRPESDICKLSRRLRTFSLVHVSGSVSESWVISRNRRPGGGTRESLQNGDHMLLSISDSSSRHHLTGVA